MGEPLDVFTPLRRAREHATKSLAAWLLASASVLVIVLYRGDWLGWPTIEHRVDAEVVEIRSVPNGTMVTFAGHADGRAIRWSRFVEDSSWEIGQDNDGWLDEEGRFHADYGLAWGGPAMLLFVFILAPFVLFAARRWTAIRIASSDLLRPEDQPRLGFVALVDDPAPKTWRPLLAVWWVDPTTRSRLPRPDAVYRADDETGGELSSLYPIRVLRAWIDTGRFRWMKPRWVGVNDNVLIPHRRAILGRWYVWMVTRKTDATRPEPMNHRAPDPLSASANHPSSPRHDFRKMLLSRLAGVLALAVIAAFLSGDGEIVTLAGVVGNVPAWPRHPRIADVHGIRRESARIWANSA